MTNNKTATAFVIALLSLSQFISAAEKRKPDFTGTWELDAAKSQGIPEGLKQVMTVKHAGDRVEVEMKMSGPQGDRTVTDVYVLDGKEAEFKPAIVSGGAAKAGKRVSTWAEDGSGFDAQEEATIDGPQGEDELKGKRTWRLSADGKVLTIEMDMAGGGGGMKSKRVFNRK
jgi:hypothetical protein